MNSTELELDQIDAERHRHVLLLLVRGALDAGQLAVALNGIGYDSRMRWLPTALNKLRREDYIQRKRGAYSLLAKGREAVS